MPNHHRQNKTRAMRSILLVLCRLSVMLLVISAAMAPAAEAPGPRPKIGLALSGGGARGLAHIGVLKVLEEAGIRPDYIAGTSMGSIVGGLAAIGYSPTDLDTLARSLDWRAILNDEVSLRSLSLEEKVEERKYAATFPIRDNRVGLPSGLVAGHRLSVLLSHLTLSVHDIDSFDDFPIPFRCIATDVETGEAKVFDRGFLPDVIRASASIPTLFTPFSYEGKTYVDGFLVRNLPATDVRAMGADIVIGVDVGTELFPQDELDSLVRIMMQTISYRSSDVNGAQQASCDILIQPDLSEIENLSFDDPADIISRGDRAARAMFEQLKALGDSLASNWGAPDSLQLPTEIDTLVVDHVEIEGLSAVSEQLFRTKLNIETPSRITPHQLERALNRAYGSQYFDRVTYRYTSQPDANTLVIKVAERDENSFRFGIHYDSVLKSSLLMNATFRNVGGQGARLLFSGRFGETPYYEASYFVPTTSRPSIGLELRLRYQNMDVTAYTPAGQTEASLDYSVLDTTLLFKSIFSNSFSLGAAIQYHYSKLRTTVASNEVYTPWDYGQLNFYGYVELDTLDRPVYPRDGYQLYIEAKRITDMFGSGFVLGGQTIDSYTIKYLEVFEVLPHLTTFGSFHGGMLSSSMAPNDYYFFLGGLRTAPGFYNLFPFAGLSPFRRQGAAAYVQTVGVQYEFRNNAFLVLRVNDGKAVMDRQKLFSKANMHYGAALSLGYLTPIGPLEYSLTASNKREGLLTHVNLGFLF